MYKYIVLYMNFKNYIYYRTQATSMMAIVTMCFEATNVLRSTYVFTKKKCCYLWVGIGRELAATSTTEERQA
jgi:hypothetical protein